MKLCIIKDKDDIYNVLKIIPKFSDKDINEIETFLTHFLNEYEQYVFNIINGDILYALGKDKKLKISNKIINHELIVHEKYKACIIDSTTKEILVVVDENNNIDVSGQIIYKK